jgi:hypothetical protein
MKQKYNTDDYHTPIAIVNPEVTELTHVQKWGGGINTIAICDAIEAGRSGNYEVKIGNSGFLGSVNGVRYSTDDSGRPICQPGGRLLPEGFVSLNGKDAR